MTLETMPKVVKFNIKGSQFTFDRQLLASNSAYFDAMFNGNFKEKHQESIELKGVEPSAFSIILNILNGKSEDLTECENVLDVLEASCMLQFKAIKQNCITFILQSWSTAETWLLIANTADKLGLTELKCKTKALALWNFTDVRKTEHFWSLLPQEVVEYLDDDRIRTTGGEFEVFEAGVSWVEFNLKERLVYSLPLLKTVRFKNLELFDIKNMLNFSNIKDTPEAKLLIGCIIEIKNGVLNLSCKLCNQPSRGCQQNIQQTVGCTCYDGSTVNTGQNLLEREGRTIPLLPCVAVGLPLNLSNAPAQTPHEKVRKKNKAPYLFIWDTIKLAPLVYLSKVDEGPTEALGYKVVVKDFKLYVIGGEYMMGQGDWNKSIWFYDTWRETWCFETSLPSPRRHHSAVCINNDIYVIGGVGRHRIMLDSVGKYNLVSKQWERCASLPTPLYSAACCTFKDDIYLFGPQTFCYRQAVAGWEVMSRGRLPDNMTVSVALSDGTAIYIIGLDAKLYSFQPEATDVQMEVLGKFKIPGNNACLINNLIYYFGQEDEDQSVEIFSIQTKTFCTAWSRTTDSESEEPDFRLHQAAGCFPLPKYY